MEPCWTIKLGIVGTGECTSGHCLKYVLLSRQQVFAWSATYSSLGIRFLIPSQGTCRGSLAEAFPSSLATYETTSLSAQLQRLAVHHAFLRHAIRYGAARPYLLKDPVLLQCRPPAIEPVPVVGEFELALDRMYGTPAP
jgi:hypothetical protein